MTQPPATLPDGEVTALYDFEERSGLWWIVVRVAEIPAYRQELGPFRSTMARDDCYNELLERTASAGGRHFPRTLQ